MQPKRGGACDPREKDKGGMPRGVTARQRKVGAEHYGPPTPRGAATLIGLATGVWTMTSPGKTQADGNVTDE